MVAPAEADVGLIIPVGVTISTEVPLERAVELARLAEQLGYSRIWVPDEGLAARDVFVALAAMAAATERILLGTGVTNPYTRHPALTASAIAGIDELSGGRTFLGYGAGGSLGLGPLGAVRARPLLRVREAIGVSRQLLAGEPVEGGWESMQLGQVRLRYTRPDLEIWFAGRGPKMLRQAGAIADGVLLGFIHKPTLGNYVQEVRTGARQGGRSPRICYSTAVITGPNRMDELRPHMTYRIVDSPPAVQRALGISDEDTAAIAAAMGRGLDAAAELIPDEWIEPFVLSGTVPECASELSTLVAVHGFDELMHIIPDMATAETVMAEVAEVAGLVRLEGSHG